MTSRPIIHSASEPAKAGRHSDARKIYPGLLNATKDPGRQAVPRNNVLQRVFAPGNGNPVSEIPLQHEG